MSSLKKKRSQKSGKKQIINAIKKLAAIGAVSVISAPVVAKAVDFVFSENVQPAEVDKLVELSAKYVQLYNVYCFGDITQKYLGVDTFASNIFGMLTRSANTNEHLVSAQNKLVKKYIIKDFFEKTTFVKFQINNKTVKMYADYRFFTKIIEGNEKSPDVLTLLKRFSVSTDKTFALTDGTNFTAYRFPDCVRFGDSISSLIQANTQYILAEYKTQTNVSHYLGMTGYKGDSKEPDTKEAKSIWISFDGDFFDTKLSIGEKKEELSRDDRIDRLLKMLEAEKKETEYKKEQLEIVRKIVFVTIPPS